MFLEKYARDSGFENTLFLADDGYSGTNFDRPSWKKIIEMIEAGQVETLIVKDMSRLGREYLQVGYYTEMYFPEKGVCFIAVNDGVDVLGRITNEQFRMLSGDYNAEQKTLEEALPGKKGKLDKLKASASNVDAFIEKVKRFTSIDELNPELLRLFIQRIEIGERAKKHSHSSPQKIRIIYKDIGVIDSEMEKGEQPIQTAAPQTENTNMQLLA